MFVTERDCLHSTQPGGRPSQAALIYTTFVFIAKSAKSPIQYNILPVPCLTNTAE